MKEEGKREYHYYGNYNRETEKKLYANLSWWMGLGSLGVGGVLVTVGLWYLSTRWGFYVCAGGGATIIGGGIATVSTLLKKT